MPAFTFNPNDLHRLNRLRFHVRRTNLEMTTGSHRNRRPGDGTEFLDYRPYVPGDDVRRVDWSLYGRLRQLFVRLNETPRQLAVTLLVDASESMSFGQPITKFQQALRIACALGFVALRGGDRLYASTFSDAEQARLGPLSGTRMMPHLIRFLGTASTGGASDLGAVVRNLSARRRARGLIVILSDFLGVLKLERAIDLLTSKGAQVLAIQILDDLDLGRGLTGSLRLEDSETGRQLDVRVDSHSLTEYQRRFEKQRAQLEELLVRRGHVYLPTTTDRNYLELVCHALQSKAVLR